MLVTGCPLLPLQPGVAAAGAEPGTGRQLRIPVEDDRVVLLADQDLRARLGTRPLAKASESRARRSTARRTTRSSSDWDPKLPTGARVGPRGSDPRLER